MIEIEISDLDYSDYPNRDDKLTLTKSKRHGVEGYTGSRYIFDSKNDIWNWDESYLFYPSLDDAYKAFENKDYDAGRKAF